MSKYVRVYESDYVEDEYLTTYQEHCEHVANIQDNGFDFEGHIVKQADTIEELIDELVIDNPENWEKKPFVSSRTFDTFLNERNANYQKKYNIKTYGAIWTDKGLIYVAKMNDKGELELL